MDLNYFLEFLKINFLMWPTKKKPSHRHIGGFVELDGGEGYSGKKYILQGCKSNRKFYRGENRK